MTVSQNEYASFKENSVQGRYIINEQIIKFLDGLPQNVLVDTLGYSVLEKPIMGVTLGEGSQKVMLWSQMHGNESTTTKAVLDLINFLCSDTEMSHKILRECTLKIIPILSPDGAEAYTRINANSIDLNRDAQDLSQPESKVLRKTYESFQPDFCFNLHDQRTIFNVGATPKPATVSFLAPAHDEERSISKNRGISMQLIVAMNNVLQELIPGQVGRYDDAFNANCVGDTFQMLQTPTILFEAGHYPEDYEREKTREYIFQAMIAALNAITNATIETYDRAAYFTIPENDKLFFDVLIKNAHVLNESQASDVGILYKEVLNGNKLSFEPKIEKTGKLDFHFGHKIYDCLIDSDLKELHSQNFAMLLQ